MNTKVDLDIGPRTATINPAAGAPVPHAEGVVLAPRFIDVRSSPGSLLH